ncbi:MAG: diphosphate--fructose-6-phosphate 1-phosphotransferase [Spirochaetales bacterium]|nr:MAG: diphosphate--fructose-6-phosphate 1-phosphotransferase [Spirochaetales bacterium]
MNKSPLQLARYQYQPKLPKALRGDLSRVIIDHGAGTESVDNHAELKQLFAHTYGKPMATFQQGDVSARSEPLRVAVVLSGGQAPGGHNVIAGIFDALTALNPDSKLFGFLKGPGGILDDKMIEITPQFLDEYRNTGGFDMIGSGRTKIESEEQFQRSLEICKKRELSALVVIGGDDSNTNAALLAEYFLVHGQATQVIGVPKTIDGDLKNEMIEVSFGFDTATRTYSELIGNIERDAASARKYWHFIKLMGRSASHIALECVLQTQANVCIISEEVADERQTLNAIVDDLVKTVLARSGNGENYGVVLVPEGLIEFVPEMKSLIGELNDLLAANARHFSTLHTYEDQAEWVNKNLTRDSSYVFSTLPNEIQRQLLMDRDPHGNVQVSRIETEKLLVELVGDRLAELKNRGEFPGSFNALTHFFGYEGRCAFPTNFDTDYCYSLGFAACVLINSGLTGYLASVRNLAHSADEWIAGGVPLTMMMTMEQRHGMMKPVIKKALVELDGAPFRRFAAHREEWAIRTSYTFPGAVQYFGPSSVCDLPSITLRVEHGVEV